ncbi:multidrug resistance-associated protein 4-like isoform X2 [Zootermopsis nevadensis]|uniref:multidrug resistance-associated protein 4-like isoform X2 n=1 Tax=Zootermopsis nevadensis TaxID=136037 RepID=UPI000B8ECA21|nr:multidrug resistance-associated protein 4-like isoform X2 [Zootermopsis nevadensis]
MNAGVKKKLSPNPRISANPLSLITFGWVVDIFRKGYKKDLEIEDLYEELDEHRSSYLGDEIERLWNSELKEASARGLDPSLLRVLIRCHGRYIMFLQLVLASVEFCLVLTQPLFLGGLIRYFAPTDAVTRTAAFGYAACIVGCTFLTAFVCHPHNLGVFHVGMKIRIGLCSLIYRKALKLSKTALGETTVGQAVNLLSNDASRFDAMFLFVAYVWIGPIQMVIIMYLVWQQIGIAMFSGVASVVLLIPLQAFIGKMISTLRLRTAKRTDQRIRFMNEIVVGIQVIKMYAWEKPFSHLVSVARKREIQAVRASSYMQGILLCFGWLVGRRIAIFMSLVTYVFLYESVTPEKMFVVTAYFNILTESMTSYISFAITHISEAYVSVQRIKNFLLYDEIAHAAGLNTGSGMSPVHDSVDDDDCRLSNGCSEVKPNSEKSKPDGADYIDTRTRGDHTDTENPLEFSGGIKITGVTAKWTDDLPENTLTDVSVEVRTGGLMAIIGPVGSGKTSLIHAILKELPLTSGSIVVGGSISYASQEPWLFIASVQQNILFGQPMDRNRYRQVVRACALEQDFRQLPHGDRTIVGERGITLSGGQKARISLARAVYKAADIYLLDDPLSAVDAHVGRHLFDDCICDFLQGKTRILVTHQLQYLHTADNIIILNHSSVSWSEQEVAAEMRSHGVVSSSVYRTYCAAGGSCGFTLLVFGVCILSQLAISSGDYWLSVWSNVEEKRASLIELPENSTVNVTFAIEINTSLPFNYGNSTSLAAKNCTECAWLPSTETCVLIYTGFLIIIFLLTFSSILLFFTMCMRASVNLHNEMFASITRATMWFFNNNPSGQILNRFSKDMGSVDEFLPHTLIDCVQIGLALLGVVLIVAVVNLWLLIPTSVMFVLFYLLRVCYVSTSRSVKRLEGITRSPVFSHLSASLQGLTTIRAFSAEAMLKKEFDAHQDLHSSAWFMFIASSRAFALWLDSVCLLYIGLVTFSFLFVDKGPYGGDVGLAITQCIGLIGMIQWGMRQSAELENSMTSLERVLEYTGVESEPPLDSPPDKKPHKNWPSEGSVVFDKVVIAYSKDDPPVLKCVSFTVKSSEKVGIVGRTGAGKSTLITALFRLVHLSGGSIQIDDVDIASIGLHDLRSKISIIPQEPILFSGTLRNNLDPFEQYSDAALWAALAEVELKQVVEELPAGLSHRVSEGGTNFSVGQRQLLCLARAIIRNNKILVLDEATANVDPQTDELIQATVRRKFADCTVLTIAHRLHTVMDSDRILVVDTGSVVEFDHPYILLKNKNGALSQMVQETGHTMTESLFRVAQTCYEEHLENSVKKDNTISTPPGFK